MDIICGRFCFFCGNYVDSCIMRDSKDRFYGGHVPADDGNPAIFLVDCLDCGIGTADCCDQWRNLTVFGFIRSRNRGFMVVLFSGITNRGY